LSLPGCRVSTNLRVTLPPGFAYILNCGAIFLTNFIVDVKFYYSIPGIILTYQYRSKYFGQRTLKNEALRGKSRRIFDS